MRGGDIREALPDRWLRKWLKRRPADVDLLVAGPPCQGFSCAKPQREPFSLYQIRHSCATWIRHADADLDDS